MVEKQIEFYICPSPECPSYYGVQGMPDLHAQFTGPMPEEAWSLAKATGSPFRHTRAACPLCKIRGIKVERVRMTLHVTVPAGPETPELPADPSDGGHRTPRAA